MTISAAERSTLQQELSNPALRDYTVVQQALADLDKGHLTAAMARLSVENDKFVRVAPDLYWLVKRWTDVL
ncbi:hypothetical protein F6X40_36440 [Paraburkholderia sp. UCT31]|uniref:hypothetical protein n=1 Tax=Paraburkholderia sp. UCT31 TaxID=2615209 RepID=UPI0016564E21|nr:hypothetical protein [Paraburkholderia sp. UCT31]MBC8742031.1 hypothetical protein [Paraburkholderia sp. UCT31]